MAYFVFSPIILGFIFYSFTGLYATVASSLLPLIELSSRKAEKTEWTMQALSSDGATIILGLKWQRVNKVTEYAVCLHDSISGSLRFYHKSNARVQAAALSSNNRYLAFVTIPDEESIELTRIDLLAEQPAASLSLGICARTTGPVHVAFTQDQEQLALYYREPSEQKQRIDLFTVQDLDHAGYARFDDDDQTERGKAVGIAFTGDNSFIAVAYPYNIKIFETRRLKEIPPPARDHQALGDYFFPHRLIGLRANSLNPVELFCLHLNDSTLHISLLQLENRAGSGLTLREGIASQSLLPEGKILSCSIAGDGSKYSCLSIPSKKSKRLATIYVSRNKQKM